MERKIISTADGSHSVSIPSMNVTYHSLHGAIQESLHVFIQAGLHSAFDSFEGPLQMLEIGFGTGLNALLTLLEAERSGRQVHYTGIEPFPLNKDEWQLLNYPEILMQPNSRPRFAALHEAPFGEWITISPHFSLRKLPILPAGKNEIMLVYQDAFAPAAAAELWTTEFFTSLSRIMQPNGILVTYCSKGEVRRSMTAAGFSVEKLKGPPGKREMVRGTVNR